jgi:methionyl-tRNA formyltransferase
MRFIVLTFAGYDNNFIEELILSKLYPTMIVSEHPFSQKRKNFIITSIKRLISEVKYLKNRTDVKKKYKAYYLAKKYGIPFWPSSKVNTDEFAEVLHEMKIDYGFVFIYKMLDEKILKTAKFGFINFHPSLLPLNRGATPSNFVILNNHVKSGVTFHFITKGIDKGAIIEQYEVPVTGCETAGALNQYLKNIGSILFVRLVFKLINNFEYPLIKNDISKGTYERPFNKDHRVIPENSSFEVIDRVVRASRIGSLTAIFSHRGMEFNVLNCVDMSNCNMGIDQYPHVDSNNNIYLKLPDQKIVLLVTK